MGRGTPGANGYLMFARQVESGGHFMQNQYTPFDTPYTYVNLEWWLFGKMAGITGLSLVAMFHVWRALTVVAFFCAIYYFAALCLPGVWARRYAVTLMALGGGLGWLIWVTNRTAGLDFPLPLDLKGVNIAGYLVNKPHFIRAGVFAALTYGFLIHGERTGQRRWFALSGLAALGHSAVHPYHIPETYLVYTLMPLVLMWREGQIDRQRIANYGTACAIFLVAVLYYGYMALENTLGMEGWRRDSIFLVEQFFWVGWPFAACCVWFVFNGFRPALIREASPAALLIAIWIFSAWSLVHTFPYFPAGQEASFFALAIAPPVAVLMGPWPALVAALRTARPKLAEAITAPSRLAALAVVSILLALPSSAYTYLNFYRDLHRTPESGPWRFYVHRDALQVITWLGDHDRTIPRVLASHATGQFVPRFIDARVVTGHDMLTPHYGEKNYFVERFFATHTPEAERRYIVDRFRVNYVFVGPEERALGNVAWETLPWLEPVCKKETATLYRVQ